MPLIHSKTPAAFKKNIKTEIAHGKPQKQAVAIAYSEKRGAEHRAEGGCVGASCGGCSDAMCMSEGGYVPGRDQHEMGVHKGQDPEGGQSWAGTLVRRGEPDKAKRVVMDKRRENRAITNENEHDRTNLAEGGEVEGPEVEDEIHGMLGEELMSAFESKDRKRVMEGLEALIMSCMNKRGEPDA